MRKLIVLLLVFILAFSCCFAEEEVSETQESLPEVSEEEFEIQEPENVEPDIQVEQPIVIFNDVELEIVVPTGGTIEPTETTEPTLEIVLPTENNDEPAEGTEAAATLDNIKAEATVDVIADTEDYVVDDSEDENIEEHVSKLDTELDEVEDLDSHTDYDITKSEDDSFDTDDEQQYEEQPIEEDEEEEEEEQEYEEQPADDGTPSDSYTHWSYGYTTNISKTELHTTDADNQNTFSIDFDIPDAAGSVEFDIYVNGKQVSHSGFIAALFKKGSKHFEMSYADMYAALDEGECTVKIVAHSNAGRCYKYDKFLKKYMPDIPYIYKTDVVAKITFTKYVEKIYYGKIILSADCETCWPGDTVIVRAGVSFYEDEEMTVKTNALSIDCITWTITNTTTGDSRTFDSGKTIDFTAEDGGVYKITASAIGHT